MAQLWWAEWPVLSSSYIGGGFVAFLSADNFLQTTIFSAAGVGGAAHDDGGDVRVYDADTLLPIPFELQFNRTNQTARLWARFPSFSGNSRLRIEWGDAALAMLPVTDANGRNAVWQDYALVVHATEDGSVATDSTGKGAITVEGGGLASATVAHPGGLAGWKFDGVDDRIITPMRDGLRAARPFTVQGWIAATNPTNDDFIINTRTYPGANTGWGFRRVGGATSAFRYTGYGVADVNSPSTVTWGTSWHAISFSANGSVGKFFRNGAQNGGDVTIGNQPSQTTTAVLSIGWFASSTSGVWSDANMSEIRISPRELSADWLATEYENQVDPLSFWGVATTGSLTPTDIEPTSIFYPMFVSSPVVAQTIPVMPGDSVMVTGATSPAIAVTMSATPSSAVLLMALSSPIVEEKPKEYPANIVMAFRVSSPIVSIPGVVSPSNVTSHIFVSSPSVSASISVVPSNMYMANGLYRPMVTAPVVSLDYFRTHWALLWDRTHTGKIDPSVIGE